MTKEFGRTHSKIGRYERENKMQNAITFGLTKSRETWGPNSAERPRVLPLSFPIRIILMKHKDQQLADCRLHY
jgi:hypothetical protein